MPTKSADVFLDFKSSVRMDLWLLGLSFRSELVNGNECHFIQTLILIYLGRVESTLENML